MIFRDGLLLGGMTFRGVDDFVSEDTREFVNVVDESE